MKFVIKYTILAAWGGAMIPLILTQSHRLIVVTMVCTVALWLYLEHRKII